MLCRDLFANRGIARITLDTMLENQRAQHVYEKLGFARTGTATGHGGQEFALYEKKIF